MSTRSIALVVVGVLSLGGCARERGAPGDSGSVTPAPISPAGAAAGMDTAPAGAPATGVPAAGGDTMPAPAGGVRPPRGATGGASTPPAPRPAPNGAASPAGTDTVRGIVAEVGSMPVTSIVVRPAGERAITVTGPLAREIGRAAGAELWIGGTRSAQGIEATRYAVRAIDGQPAIDGTLVREGERWVLVTASARRPLGRVPEAFRDLVGGRVWIVGSTDAVSSYGVLRAP